MRQGRIVYYDTSKLDWKTCYKLLASTVVPRPIAWVVSTNEDGSSNAAPFSFFNYFAGFPPVVCIGMTTRASGPCDSLINIRRTGEFVINLVTEDLVGAMTTTAIEFPPGVSEIEEAGLHTVPSTMVQVPRIEASPVALECKLTELKDVLGNTGFLVLGCVVGIHVADEALIDAARCCVDTAKLKLVGRMESPACYVHTGDRFTMPTPGFDEWEARVSAA